MFTVKQMISRLHLEINPVCIPGSTIWCCQIELTVKLATDWLERYNNRNRNSRKGTVAMHSENITKGHWRVTHQGIAFDAEGEMISGQHRCLAVVKSGMSIQVLVFVNCDPEERKVIDQTVGRDVKDVGLLGHGNVLDTVTVGMGRAMYFGASKEKRNKMSPSVLYDFIETHRDAMVYVRKFIPKHVPGVTTSSVLGAIGHAYYKLKRSDIQHFIEVLVSGFSDSSDDRVIIQLRNILLESQGKRRSDEYSLTQAALSSFSKREPVGRILKPASDELFPLPALKQV